MYTMRGRSLECLGHVAVAIGAEHFERYFEPGFSSILFITAECAGNVSTEIFVILMIDLEQMS